MAKRLHEIVEQVMQVLNNLIRQDLSSSSSSSSSINQAVDEHVVAQRAVEEMPSRSQLKRMSCKLFVK